MTAHRYVTAHPGPYTVCVCAGPLVALTVGVQGMSDLSTFVCRSQILYVRVIHCCKSESDFCTSKLSIFVYPNQTLHIRVIHFVYQSYISELSTLCLRVTFLYIRVIYVNIRIKLYISELSTLISEISTSYIRVM